MTQKPISAGKDAAKAMSIRVVIVTLDNHLASAVRRAQDVLRADVPGLYLSLHAAAEWGSNQTALHAALADIECADILVANMLFMEDHIQAVLPALAKRAPYCDALVGCMAGQPIVKITRMGGLKMDGSDKGLIALLKKLKPKKKEGPSPANAGSKQMAMLRRLPKVLKYIPGTAQDLRAYFLTLQYWLGGSDDNITHMVRFLINRYASGPRLGLRGKLPANDPKHYPETGVYHPALSARMADDASILPRHGKNGSVGLLVMRSYLLAGNSSHYDGVIAALEARGLNVIPAFASGLDARPAIEAFFMKDGSASIDALVSLTGFSLVGGPAYNDAKGAEDILAKLDVPYVAAQGLEFQTLEQWEKNAQGLMPVEATMMVAIPELDGATGSMVFGGRSIASDGRDMAFHPERSAMLAARVAKLIALRKTHRSQRKLGIVLFNFPPNAGSVGSAAHLSVFESLYNVLQQLQRDGYDVDVPQTVDALRERVLVGNSARFGAQANVHHRIPASDHIRREAHIKAIEKQWGPAPGKQQSDGGSLFVLGAQFGNVFVGVQPAFGYEGDPMRLLFENGFAPTHAFSAFYRWLREDFAADALLHFGTHGALEFMPGKQTGLSEQCWPDRLIRDIPNFYLYAANNPSEGMLAKRRSAATLISHLTPPITSAGLYKGLLDLKSSIGRWRALAPDANSNERDALALLIQAQGAAVDLCEAEPEWTCGAEQSILALNSAMLDLEQTLIPFGLHVVGAPMPEDKRNELLSLLQETMPAEAIADVRHRLEHDTELPALIHALDGRFIAPAPGGDLLRTPEMLPTGRNIHGFDPYRIPSAFAIKEGEKQAAKLLARHLDEAGSLPKSIAFVLWGTDNMKTEGGPIAQALALMGAKARFDGYGRLCGAELIPLNQLNRPRIDVVMTLSGIFRDLLPLQTKLLAEAAWLAASAEEPLSENFVRANALAYAQAHGCDLETAALRVFSNADGAYGSNVNHLIDNGRWDDEDELAETFTRRKCFAFGRQGQPSAQPDLLKRILTSVDLAYQNLDSVELGVTTIDTYFDTLGGVTRSIKRASGADVPVYISDQTRGEGKVRTLNEQVSLETRTRTLNPKWYESMLQHGYEGVRQIEAHITNTMGWSATTGQVAPWVYQRLTQTYVLDDAMRKRLAELNPTAAARMVNRLNEAHERNYWAPDAETLDALRRASEELEDRLEGVHEEVA